MDKGQHLSHGGGSKKFGVDRVTISYHYNGRQYEVDINPDDIDVMIFGWENYKKYRKKIDPDKDLQHNLNHLWPNGKTLAQPKEPWPFSRIGVLKEPRDVGVAIGGSADDFCWHTPTCEWWCVAGTHETTGGMVHAP